MSIREGRWPGPRGRDLALDVALGVLFCLVPGVGAVVTGTGPAALIIGGSALLAVLVATLRRRAPMVAFVVAAALAALTPALNVGLFVTSYAVGRYVRRWPVRIAAALLGAVIVSMPWAAGTGATHVSRVAAIAPIILLPGAVGIYVRTRALLLQALRDRADKAEAERELLARDAVLSERTRIAREMHDAVGHRVSLMVLQAGAIELAAADRERVEQLAGQVQTAGRQALEELRQMVGVLRSEDDEAPLAPQPGLAELPGLVQHAKDAGLAVELVLPPDAAVDPAAGRAAYRIVQEALTNAGKHAPGAAVRVTVERPRDRLVVRVVNGPSQRPGGDAHSGGFGLVGLAERVRTLGGRLATGPRLDGGFEVEAVLPS